MTPLGLVLLDPPSAVREAIRRPRPGVLALAALAGAAVLGAATLPRQLSLLAASLAPTGNMLRDLHHAAMRTGLLRLIIADRLVPPPTIVIGAVVLALAAEPILSLAEDRRRAIWAVLLLGLAPLLVQRMGELAVTYLAAVGEPVRPGDAVGLPQRFTTGPLLLWRTGDPPPWLVSLSQRANLISVWSLILWTIGLKTLDGRRLSAWHVALPPACLGLSAFLTWWLTPMVASLLLGSP